MIDDFKARLKKQEQELKEQIANLHVAGGAAIGGLSSLGVSLISTIPSAPIAVAGISLATTFGGWCLRRSRTQEQLRVVNENLATLDGFRRQLEDHVEHIEQLRQKKASLNEFINNARDLATNGQDFARLMIMDAVQGVMGFFNI